MSPVIHLEKEVNTMFKMGLQHLLLGFDIDEFVDIVNTIKDNQPFCIFIDSESLEEVIKPYAYNWKSVRDEYFVWDPRRFMDPVDQCKYIVEECMEEIWGKLLKGLRVDPLCPFYKRIEAWTAHQLDRLMDPENGLLAWAVTHKFFVDDLDMGEIEENVGE